MNDLVPSTSRPRCLILIVAQDAEATIGSLVRQIPAALALDFDLEILILEDGSSDKTLERSQALVHDNVSPFAITVLANSVSQGMGGSQKLGFHFAIQRGFDLVLALDAQNLEMPARLPQLLAPLMNSQAGAVVAVPLRRSLVTRLQNWVLRSDLQQYGALSGAAYRVASLKLVPFRHNANDACFQTELAIQFHLANIPTMDLRMPVGPRFGQPALIAKILATTFQARLQELSLFYNPKYDCAATPVSQYLPKFGYRSPHSFALDALPATASVLDLGCARGYMGAALRDRKACSVTGVDSFPLAPDVLDRFYQRDLNHGLAGVPVEQHDFVLLLDVLEHLAKPDLFLDELRERLSLNQRAELILSTGNVAFFVTRFMLLIGKFNYGKRGILDLTHTRLFTFASMKAMLEQTGFDVTEVAAIPAPFPLALGDNGFSRLLLKLNTILSRWAPGLFAYQMVMRARPRPTLGTLLKTAQHESDRRAESLSAASNG